VLRLQLSAATGLPFACQDETLVKMKLKSRWVKYIGTAKVLCVHTSKHTTVTDVRIESAQVRRYTVCSVSELEPSSSVL